MRAVLPSLEINLAAHATDAVPQGSGNTASASGKHDITSKTIPAFENATILSTGHSTYVVWKPELHLVRPRARLQRPAVYFTAYLAVTAETLRESRRNAADYLKNFESLSANVLEPLNFDSSAARSKLYLSEQRITKIEPASSRAQDNIKPIRGASKRAFPILPALFTRVRYSALPDSIIASLHIETSQAVTGSVQIRDVKLQVIDAGFETLTSVGWPRDTQAGDEIVLLYKIKALSEDATNTTSSVLVQLDATVSPKRESETQLDIRWQTEVDLSQQEPKPTYKWSRPLSGASHVSKPSLQGVPRPNSLEADVKCTTSETGITFNFTATPTVVQHEEFKVDVHCVNRSTRSRRFALVVLPPKRMQPSRHQDFSNSENADVVANIFNAPPLERPKVPDVLDLNPDVRIGPLPPGAIYETQLKFRAMAAGVFDLGVIRIVDVDTRQTVDVRELPDIISLEETSQATSQKFET